MKNLVPGAFIGVFGLQNSLEMSTEFFSCIEQCAQPSWAEKSVIHKKVIVQGALAPSKKKLILIKVSTLGQMGSVGVKLEGKKSRVPEESEPSKRRDGEMGK